MSKISMALLCLMAGCAARREQAPQSHVIGVGVSITTPDGVLSVTSGASYLMVGIWSADLAKLLCTTSPTTGTGIKSMVWTSGPNVSAGVCTLPPVDSGYKLAITGDSNLSGLQLFNFDMDDSPTPLRMQVEVLPVPDKKVFKLWYICAYRN